MLVIALFLVSAVAAAAGAAVLGVRAARGGPLGHLSRRAATPDRHRCGGHGFRRIIIKYRRGERAYWETRLSVAEARAPISAKRLLSKLITVPLPP